MSIEARERARPALGARVYVHGSAQLSGRVTAGDDVSFWPLCVARGDVNTIEIGARSNVQDGALLHATHDGPYSPGGLALWLGEDVTVGHRAVLHACRVGARCLIGIGAIVLDGAELGCDVLVAAGSLVPPGKRLEPATLYRGSPARRVRALTREELDMLRYSAAHYVRLKDRYLSAASGQG
jgi:carbonic anhydrase/acetyltransferase-like protein (isoleucine patch superfamily)